MIQGLTGLLLVVREQNYFSSIWSSHNVPSHWSPGLRAGRGARPNITGNKSGLITAMTVDEQLTIRVRLRTSLYLIDSWGRQHIMSPSLCQILLQNRNNEALMRSGHTACQQYTKHKNEWTVKSNFNKLSSYLLLRLEYDGDLRRLLRERNKSHKKDNHKFYLLDYVTKKQKRLSFYVKTSIWRDICILFLYSVSC